MTNRKHCKNCKNIEFDELGFDELGLCGGCRTILVSNIVNDLTKPLYVYRMAGAITPLSANEAQVRSAKTRFRNAERDIIKILADRLGLK